MLYWDCDFPPLATAVRMKDTMTYPDMAPAEIFLHPVDHRMDTEKSIRTSPKRFREVCVIVLHPSGEIVGAGHDCPQARLALAALLASLK